MVSMTSLPVVSRFKHTVQNAKAYFNKDVIKNVGLGAVANRLVPSFQNIAAVPGLMAFATVVKRLGTKIIDGTEFKPVPLNMLNQQKEAMDPVLDTFGLELEEIQQHIFSPEIRKPGPFSDSGSAIAPKFEASSAVAAITVSINGAETGGVHNYKKAKTRIDGIGAISTNNGMEEIGKIISRKFGNHIVCVQTEGTPSHSKVGESAIGNPTIPIGKLYPANLTLNKVPIGKSGKIFIYDKLTPIFFGVDVVEGTEIASTTLETYQTISGRPNQPKDNGAASVFSVYDQAAVLADTYANKIIVTPKIAKALGDKDINLSLEEPLEETFKKIAEATGRKISDISVMGLGLKPRLKGNELKNDREGRIVLFDKLEEIGIKNILTFDDGESPAVGLMAKNQEVVFDNGEKGKVDVMLGPGGVFETVTALRTIADVCETGYGKYAGVWGYVSKAKSKNAETYFDMHNIPANEMKPYDDLGIDPKGSQGVSEILTDDGDRAFIVTSITDNPRLNPHAIKPIIDWDENTITVYQEVVRSSGAVEGRYITLKAKHSINKVIDRLSAVLPNLMSQNIDKLKLGLQEYKNDANAMEALKNNMEMYLYSLIKHNKDADGPPFYLHMNELLLRRHVYSEDDQKALAVLRFATKENPEWFANSEAIVDSKRIIFSSEYTVEKDEADNPTKVIPNNNDTLYDPRKMKKSSGTGPLPKIK